MPLEQIEEGVPDGRIAGCRVVDREALGHQSAVLGRQGLGHVAPDLFDDLATDRPPAVKLELVAPDERIVELAVALTLGADHLGQRVAELVDGKDGTGRLLTVRVEALRRSASKMTARRTKSSLWLQMWFSS